MSEPTYIGWADGYGAKVKAEDAYGELEAIRRANGGELNRDLVKEAARDKSSPLHPQVFDCAPKTAAERYYSRNAQKLISAIVVTYAHAPEAPTRKYVVCREEPKQSAPRGHVSVFTDVAEALQDPEHREYVLGQALASLGAWRKRYAALSELAGVFKAIDAVAAKTA